MELKVINPYNQETVCALPYADERKDRRSLDQARKRPFASGPTARGQAHGNRPRRAGTLSRARGSRRPRHHVSDGQADRAIAIGIPRDVRPGRLHALHRRKSLASDILPPKPEFRRRIDHVPMGVVFNIAAWNYPLLIPINVVVPALCWPATRCC